MVRRAVSARSGRATAYSETGPYRHQRYRYHQISLRRRRGSRCPRRCRGRARGQGRTGRTQRRSQLKARWPVDRDKTLSRFCPAWKSKNFVSRARNTPLRSVFLSAWVAKISWSCSARPASLGFPEPPDLFRPPTYLEPGPSPRERPGNTKTGRRLGRRPLPGRMGFPTGPAREGGGDYRCVVRGGDTNLLPVAGMPPNTGGVPTAANRVGTAAQGRFWDQSPVGQFVEIGKLNVAGGRSQSAPSVST
jgi:hypothetical protein